MDRSELCGAVMVRVFAGDRVVIEVSGEMDARWLLIAAVIALINEIAVWIK